MKSIFTLFLLTFLFFSNLPAHAQGWEVGVHLGENLSTLTGDQQNDYRLGFVGGAFAGHYLARKLVMRLEINIERKGAINENRDPLNPDPNFVPDYRLDYLSVPVMLRYYTGEEIRFLVGAGVSANYLLRGNTEFGNLVDDRTEEFNRLDTDLIACFGGGYEVTDNIILTLELRSIFGMVKVEQIDGTARDLGRNIAWGLRAGFNYRLK